MKILILGIPGSGKIEELQRQYPKVQLFETRSKKEMDDLQTTIQCKIKQHPSITLSNG